MVFLQRFLLIVLSMVLMCNLGLAQTASTPLQLSQADTQIYQYTLSQCRSGSPLSALGLGFSFEISSLKNSPGFWQAMTDCYGYKYGTLNYGNLMKQLVDFGQLTQYSVTALYAGHSITSLLAARGMAAASQTPLLSSFLNAGMTFLWLHQAYKELVPLIYPQETPEVEANLLGESQQKKNKIKIRARERLNEIDAQMKDPKTDSATRDGLAQTKLAIEKALIKLEALEKGI